MKPALHAAFEPGWRWAAPTALVLCGLLAGCGDQTRGSSTPAAMESPNSRGQDSTLGTTTATPAAADTPAGGSAGHRGISPVPDASSGGPAGGSGSAPGAVGAAPSRPAPEATSTPEPGSGAPTGGFTARPGLPAEATGRMGSQGSTNSTPSSSTGNASR